ncbi:ATP-binding protein [Gemmatimonadota bacterium]
MIYRTTLKKSGIPKRYYEQEFESFSEGWLLENGEALQRVQDFTDSFKSEHHTNGHGLLIVGPPGVGKTMAACCLGKDVIRAGYSVFYSTMQDLIQSSYEALNNSETRTWLYGSIVQQTDLLIVDELDGYYDPGKGLVDCFIDRLIGVRYNNCRSTLFISNTLVALKLGDWAKDRIKEMSEKIVFNGNSQREWRNEEGGSDEDKRPES